MFDLRPLLRDLDRPLESYRTPEGVYNLLPASVTPGDHVEHYHRDALEFDYFNLPSDAATNHESERLHQAILQHVPAEARTILDVGCGNGWVARELLPSKGAVISFDLALQNAAGALERYPAPNHVAVVGDAFDLPFRDGSLDAIVSSEVMEHVPDVPLYLANLIRVVKPGGTIVISTPYDERIQYSLCIHCNRPTPLHAHLHRFNERLVTSLLDPFPGITFQLEKLSNKALLYLRTHRFLSPLPFPAWRALDRLANGVVKKPGRLLIVVVKSQGVD